MCSLKRYKTLSCDSIEIYFGLKCLFINIAEKRRPRQPQSPKVPVAPETPIGVVTLTQPSQSYHQLAKDEMMHMLVPQASLYPNSKFYVPVFLEQPLTDTAPITAFTIK